MQHDDPDERSFADEMAQLGVVPLDHRRGDERRGKPRTQARSGAGKVRATGEGLTRPTLTSAPTGRAPGSDSPARPPSPPSAPSPAMTAELTAMRERVRALEDENRALRDERNAWQRERKILEQRGQRKRDELLAERNKLRAELAQAEAVLGGKRSLADILRARGCATIAEQAELTRGLLELLPREFLNTVDVLAGADITRLLDQRVVFAADGVDINDDSCVVLRVSAERCEITGGSDIQAGYREFTDACERAGLRTVTIIGGSPAYRRQLQRLGDQSHAQVRLNLVSGTKRRTKKRADADMRKSDLVIIWGGTELDHSVTAVYTSAPEKTLRMPHRGISRMLLQAAAELRQRK